MNTPGIGDLGLGIGRATGVTLALTLLASIPLFAQNPADPTMRPRPTNPTNRHEPYERYELCRRERSDRRPYRVLVENRSQRRAGRRELHPHVDLCRARHRARQGRRRRVWTCALGAPSGAVRHRRRRAVPRHPECSASVLSISGTRCGCSAKSSSARTSRCRGFRSAIACRTRCREVPRCRGAKRSTRLVPVPIRVLSLVPAGTADIRDTPADTFGDVDRRLFRSNLLYILASVAFVLAGLMAVMLVARAAVKRRATAATRQRTMSAGAVLRAASRELGAVRAASQSGGWNSDLAGRAAAALRLAGAVALARPVSHKEVDRDTAPTEGQVVAAPGLGLLRGRKTVLSASVTPDTTVLNGGSASAAESWRSSARRSSRSPPHDTAEMPASTARRSTPLLPKGSTRSRVCASHSGGDSAGAGVTPKLPPPDRHGHAERAHRAGRRNIERVALERHRRSRLQRARSGAARGGVAGRDRGHRARVALASRQAAGTHGDRAAGCPAARHFQAALAALVRAARAVSAVPGGPSVLLLSRSPIRTRRCRRDRSRIRAGASPSSWTPRSACCHPSAASN